MQVFSRGGRQLDAQKICFELIVHTKRFILSISLSCMGFGLKVYRNTKFDVNVCQDWQSLSNRCANFQLKSLQAGGCKICHYWANVVF